MTMTRDLFAHGSVVAAIYALACSPIQDQRAGVVLKRSDPRVCALGSGGWPDERPVLWAGGAIEWVTVGRLCRFSRLSEFAP